MPIAISSLKRRGPIGLPMPVVMPNDKIEVMSRDKEPQFKSTVLKRKRDSPEDGGVLFVR